MTALAEPAATAAPRPAALSRELLVPALLLLPCLVWIAFFFLLPLALMCWRSLASEGFSLEPYSASVHLAALHQGHADDREDREHRDGRSR